MIILDKKLLKLIYPAMSDHQAEIFVTKQAVMKEILQTAQRAAICFANVQVEVAGFNDKVVRNMTENIMHTPQSIAKNWPNRFNRGKDAKGKWIPDPAAVIRKYGTGLGWQLKAFDDIYGGRMKNRPGTSDGSTFIGRGPPQITGREGYEVMSKALNVDFVNHPERMSDPAYAPFIIAAFWAWKRMSVPADAGNIVECRRLWNGGRIGLDVVQKHYPRILKILETYKPVTGASVVVPNLTKVDPVLKEHQQALIDCGYHEIGQADGKLGAKTLGAIKAFFTDRGVNAKTEYPSTALTTELNRVIQDEWHRPIAPGRAFATEEDLAPSVASIAPTQSAGFGAKIMAWFGGVGSIGSAAVQAMPSVSDSLSPYKAFVQEYFPGIPTIVILAVVAAVAIYTVREVNKAKAATVSDYQRGKIN